MVGACVAIKLLSILTKSCHTSFYCKIIKTMRKADFKKINPQNFSVNFILQYPFEMRFSILLFIDQNRYLSGKRIFNTWTNLLKNGQCTFSGEVLYLSLPASAIATEDDCKGRREKTCQ